MLDDGFGLYNFTKNTALPPPARAEQLGLQGRAEAWLLSVGSPPAALIQAALNESCFPQEAILPGNSILLTSPQ